MAVRYPVDDDRRFLLDQLEFTFPAGSVFGSTLPFRWSYTQRRALDWIIIDSDLGSKTPLLPKLLTQAMDVMFEPPTCVSGKERQHTGQSPVAPP